MLKFQKLDRENMKELAPYFAVQNTNISDYSLGFQFMWGETLQVDYCFAGEYSCLVLHEFYAGSHYFYYPLSIPRSSAKSSELTTGMENVDENEPKPTTCTQIGNFVDLLPEDQFWIGDEAAENSALDEIERYCRDNEIRLHYTNVPHNRLSVLLSRYDECTVNNRRRWRDYLYHSDDFKNYSGKKYAGQRNHVNKFKKLYTGWQFRPYEPADEEELIAFLKEYAEGQIAKDVFLAREEMEETLCFVPKLKTLRMSAGLLIVDGKIVGFSAGERCGDMIVVHIEKALREYEGAYPMLAQQFALSYCIDGVRFLNRMDDAGDGGLRKSKLQYLPCEVVGKYNVLPKRAIDSISKIPEIKTERLLIASVRDDDAETFYRLAYDRERNKYWGYDWREDYPEGDPPKEYFLETAREWFHKKWEMSLGIYVEDKLVGEAVLHRFGYRADVELGVRLLPEAEGKGYASEAMSALASYAFLKLGMDRADAKCYRQNIKSDRMLRAAGFHPCGKDEIFTYYYKTAGM